LDFQPSFLCILFSDSNVYQDTSFTTRPTEVTILTLFFDSIDMSWPVSGSMVKIFLLVHRNRRV